jgi:hypothetical protein
MSRLSRLHNERPWAQAGERQGRVSKPDVARQRRISRSTFTPKGQQCCVLLTCYSGQTAPGTDGHRGRSQESPSRCNVKMRRASKLVMRSSILVTRSTAKLPANAGWLAAHLIEHQRFADRVPERHRMTLDAPSLTTSPASVVRPPDRAAVRQSCGDRSPESKPGSDVSRRLDTH